MLQYELVEQSPTLSQFAELRNLVGWDNPSLDALNVSITNSLYWVSMYEGKKLIGTGRVVGDGAMYFYIQDIIVHPDYQGKGLGIKLMKCIESYLEGRSESGVTIGLFAAQGKEGFYKQFEYVERDGVNLGLGMCRFI